MWRKPGYGFANGNCAEAASGGGAILVRDTTDRDGFTLAVPAVAWQRFTRQLAAR